MIPTIRWKNKINRIADNSMSIVKKTVMWILVFNILHLFHKSKEKYIKKNISDIIIQTLTVMLFVSIGFCIGYVTIIILFGTERDIEKTCYYIIQHHIAFVISLIYYELF